MPRGGGEDLITIVGHEDNGPPVRVGLRSFSTLR